MITDGTLDYGTCYIVEDNIAKDKIFTINFSAIKAFRSDLEYYMKMLIWSEHASIW